MGLRKVVVIKETILYGFKSLDEYYLMSLYFASDL